jgi:hypothetical protein
MKLIIRKSGRFLQRYHIWIEFGNHVKTQLRKRYFNMKDALDTCDTLKDEMGHAEIVTDFKN